ncbi:MAG: DNA polymerase III subunit alpha, partial [Treponema sp.]|nr:DNA polymerase III subunit alpha [Treponema sp.]
DYRGDIELVFFGKAWESCQGKIAEGKPAALKGRLDKKRERPSLRVGSLLDLDRLGKKAEKMAENMTEKAAEAGNTPVSGISAGTSAAVQAAADHPVASRIAPQEPRWRELHIRLSSNAAQQEDDLLPLRDQLMEHPGPCQVYIHVPASHEPGRRETVIRSASQISAAATTTSIDILKQCLGVAEVWGE